MVSDRGEVYRHHQSAELWTHHEPHQVMQKLENFLKNIQGQPLRGASQENLWSMMTCSRGNCIIWLYLTSLQTQIGTTKIKAVQISYAIHSLKQKQLASIRMRHAVVC